MGDGSHISQQWEFPDATYVKFWPEYMKPLYLHNTIFESNYFSLNLTRGSPRWHVSAPGSMEMVQGYLSTPTAISPSALKVFHASLNPDEDDGISTLAFAYPENALIDFLTSEQVDFCQLGGFVYLGDSGEVLGLRTLSRNKTKSDDHALHLGDRVSISEDDCRPWAQVSHRFAKELPGPRVSAGP